MTPRRRRQRTRYENDRSVFGNPTNVERVAIGIAEIEVGPLSDRERKIAISCAHFFSGALLDNEALIQELEAKVLELHRIMGG